MKLITPALAVVGSDETLATVDAEFLAVVGSDETLATVDAEFLAVVGSDETLATLDDVASYCLAVVGIAEDTIPTPDRDLAYEAIDIMHNKALNL